MTDLSPAVAPLAGDVTRRRFLATSSAVLASAYVAESAAAASTAQDIEKELKADKTPIALIGAGGMGTGNLRSASDYVDVVAVCDVDANRRDRANQSLAGGKATVHEDYREILDNDAIEVVHIATPDHWHTKPLVEALRAGKDVYCEKPLTLTIAEGQLIREVQQETGRVVQVGTQQRSQFDLFVKAVAIAGEGRLGKIRRVQAAIGGGPACEPIPAVDPPSELNWDRWLGPAPKVDYRFRAGGDHGNTNCHYEFRWWYEYSGGKLTDWGAHHIDIAKWALEANGQMADPTSIGGSATHPVPFENGQPTENDRYNTATEFLITAKFPDDVELVIRHDTENGVLIEGDKGRIFVNRGKLVGAPVEELASNPLPDDAIQRVYKGHPLIAGERKGHWANFLHCVRTREEPVSDVHSHMRALNIGHLAGISARLGRDLEWDEASQQIVGDDEALAMQSRPYREGYEIAG